MKKILKGTQTRTVAVDQNGNYSVGQLPASKYTLLAKPCDTANFYPTYFVHSLSAERRDKYRPKRRCDKRRHRFS